MRGIGPDPDDRPDGDHGFDGRESGAFVAPDLEDWYDEDTLATVDRWGDRRSVLSSDEADHVGAPPPFASRLTDWSRRTTIGMVMKGMALGLEEVYRPKDQEVIVIEVDDNGFPHDLPVQLLLDPDDPRGSLALVHRSEVKPPQV